MLFACINNGIISARPRRVNNDALINVISSSNAGARPLAVLVLSWRLSAMMLIRAHYYYYLIIERSGDS